MRSVYSVIFPIHITPFSFQLARKNNSVTTGLICVIFFLQFCSPAAAFREKVDSWFRTELTQTQLHSAAAAAVQLFCSSSSYNTNTVASLERRIAAIYLQQSQNESSSVFDETLILWVCAKAGGHFRRRCSLTGNTYRQTDRRTDDCSSWLTAVTETGKRKGVNLLLTAFACLIRRLFHHPDFLTFMSQLRRRFFPTIHGSRQDYKHDQEA